jgi:hypothetical protein
MNEEKLEKELEAYRELAKADKKIDVAGLMINALQKHESNMFSVKQKRWAYLISIAIPPVGFLLALNFFMSDKDDGPQAALWCSILTVVSIIITVLLMKVILAP